MWRQPACRCDSRRSSLATKQKIVAAPEQSLNAANTIQTTNTSSQPLLPGKVALYKDGAFSGNTDMDFVATGEKFAMFLNAAEHIKLSRVLDKKQSSLLRESRPRCGHCNVSKPWRP